MEGRGKLTGTIMVLTAIGLALVPAGEAISLTPFPPGFYDFYGTFDACTLTKTPGDQATRVELIRFEGRIRVLGTPHNYDLNTLRFVVNPAGEVFCNEHEDRVQVRGWGAGLGTRDSASLAWPTLPGAP